MGDNTLLGYSADTLEQDQCNESGSSRYREIQIDPLLFQQMIIADPNEHEYFPLIEPILKLNVINSMTKIIKVYLTDSQRECIQLYFWGNKTEAEISAILNRHQTTVSQHLRYAFKKIRRYLLKEYPEIQFGKRIR